MSSLIRVNLLAAALLTLMCAGPTASASAAVHCPSVAGGRQLRMMGGGSLYLGNPAANMVQAPDGTEQGPNGPVTTWRFRSGEELKLVCRYDGTQAAVVLPLAREMKICRQEARIRSFVCQ